MQTLGNKGKCLRISYSKVVDKMVYANSADPDQNAPEGAVWSRSTQFATSLSILKNNLKKQILGPKSMA